MKRFLTATALLAITAAPAWSADMPQPIELRDRTPTIDMAGSEREAYRRIFAAIRGRDWAIAQSLLATAPRSVLHPVARAELYLAAGSPRVELDPLVSLIGEAPDLPNADQLRRLAESRGLAQPLSIRSPQQLRTLPGPSRRALPRGVSHDSAARALVDRIQPLIVDDDPRGAEALVDAEFHNLSSEGQAEVRQRVAWSYYITGDDANARRLAHLAQNGQGEWVAHAAWVEGLAAWRQRDYAAAARAFGAVGSRGSDSDMRAAGLYWAARAETAAGKPENVQPLLRTASRLNETFYGMLAGQRLGIVPQPVEPAHETSAAAVYPDSNAQRALALLAIGERDLAGQYVRHGAALDHAQRHDAWVAFAEQLGLPDAQVWITRNAPVSHHPSVRDRYPNPGYRPVRGWRVDRSLVYAHALQESSFNATAVSGANAHGLMQVRPGTAGDIARQRGYAFGAGQLHQPEYSIEFGQSYLENMRDFPATRGLLPQVIAAYNAGPGPVRDWQYSLRDGGDPLLYIESIPYYETRQYVPIVLRNYWMYQRTNDEDTPTLSALAQGLWPRFPGSSGPVAVRMSDYGAVRLGD